MENNFDTIVMELQSFLGDRCSTGDSIIDLHSRDAAYTPPVKPHAVVVRLSRLGWAVRSRVK